MAHRATPFTYLRFSLDGNKLLAVGEGCVYILDAFKGVVIQKLMTGAPDMGAVLEACFSPDGKYVLAGMYIHLWFHSVLSTFEDLLQ